MQTTTLTDLPPPPPYPGPPGPPVGSDPVYPPQQQPYDQSKGGYYPSPQPPAGYGQPPAGYSQPQAGYAHPAAAQYVPTSQQHTVIVTQPQVTSTVVVRERRNAVNHPLHCLISLIFWPWIIVWICLCIAED